MRCTICDATLPPFRPAGPPLCGALACAWKYRALAPHQLCTVCGHQLSPSDQVAKACAGECRITLQQRQRSAARTALDPSAVELTGTVTIAAPRVRGMAVPVVRIPAFEERTTRTPKRRRDQMRRRLEWLLEQRADRPTPPSSIPLLPVLEPVIQSACTACRGHCCREGNDHAYLSAGTMQRVRADHPDLSDQQIIDAYLSHLGPRSYHNSCVFHQATGCALPRSLRSDTCNSFYCDPIRTLLTDPERDASAPVFLASVNRKTMRAGVLFDGASVSRVRPEPTCPPPAAPGTPLRTPASAPGESA